MSGCGQFSLLSVALACVVGLLVEGLVHVGCAAV
jgi:hypothetical protein